MTARRGWRRRAVVLGALAAIAGGLVASISLPAGADVSRTAAIVTGTAKPAGGPRGTVIGGPSEAREAAARAAQTLPLPAGGNFNGIRWEEAGGVFTDVDVAFVTQYNATCQWYRALSDGREPQRAAQIVQEAPSWPALRDTEPAAALVAAAREVLTGSFGPAAGALLEQCRAAHAREVAWAQQMGLAPST
jgi:hypothetical protein